MTTHDAGRRKAPGSETWSELDSRTSDGLQVSLLWCAVIDEVRVGVSDARAGESFEFQVRAPDALAAFLHPFSYAPAHDRRSSTGTPANTQPNPHPTGARHVTH